MSVKVDSEFGAIRSFLWPIHRREIRKILPLLFMLFLICFNYSLLKNMKDSVVITASGAEVIPFIKVWVMLPTAVLLTYTFTKLTNRFSQEHVFYIMTSGFLIFFAVFAFILYPFRESLHPHATANALEQILPLGFKWIISMFRNWTYTAFYVISELWSSIVMSVLFWGFANEITRIGEARRFYSVFGVGSNFAAIIAGLAGNFVSQNGHFNPNLPFGNDHWEQTQMLLVIIITASGLITMALFRWMNKNVLNDPSFDDLHSIKKATKAKGRLSLRESFAYLSNSKYLICIAVLVVSYNLVINLVEIVWKAKVKVLYPMPSDYNTYMNNLTSIIGVISTLTAFFIAKIIGKFGWTRTALITPFIMLVTCLGFFSFLFFQDHLEAVFLAFAGTTPLAIAVFFGASQNCLSKAAKYSVFDSTKEMAFIPLDHESKLKGKAAIDGVGSRLGKSGGSLIHQGLLMLFGSLSLSMPYVAAILMAVIGIWIVAVRSLGQKFGALVITQDPALKAQPKVEPTKELDPNKEPIPLLS